MSENTVAKAGGPNKQLPVRLRDRVLDAVEEFCSRPGIISR